MTGITVQKNVCTCDNPGARNLSGSLMALFPGFIILMDI